MASKANKNKVVHSLLLFSVFGFSACGQFKVPAVKNSQFKFEVKSLEKADIQTAALVDRLSSKHEVDVLKRSFVSSVEVVDILNEPFFNLVFFTPTKIQDPLIDGLQLAEDLCQNVDDAECIFSTTIAGASTSREMISSREKGVHLLRKLSRAAAHAGGRQQVKRIVAFSAAALFIETQSGQFIDLQSNQIIDVGTLMKLSSQYLQIKEKHTNSPEFQKMMNVQWQDYIKYSSEKRVETKNSTGFRVQKASTGNIDVGSMLASIDQKSLEALVSSESGHSSFSAQKETETKSCLLWICWTSRVNGSLEAGDKPYDQIMGGFSQTPKFAMIEGQVEQKFAEVPSCNLPFNSPVPASYVQTGFFAGCAPAAFMALVDWWWRYKDQSFFGKRFNGEPIQYTQATIRAQSKLYKFVQPGSIWPDLLAKNSKGYAQITSDFNGCFFRNGTLTLPSAFIAGSEKTLARAGNTDMKVEGVFNYIGGNVLPFVNNTYSLAAQLRKTVGQRNIPAIVLYPFSENYGELHYSAVQDFEITYNLGLASIKVRTADSPDQMISITDPWTLGSGVYNLTD